MLSLLNLSSFNNHNNFLKVQKLILNQIENPNDKYVDIYNFQILDASINQYKYQMEYLEPLSLKEKKLVQILKIHKFDRVKCLKEKDSTTFPNLIDFILNAHYSEHYIDLHYGNVRKTKLGKYKLIDLEGKIGL